MPERTVAVAGATGDLGGRIVAALRARGAEVVALVRPGTEREREAPLRAAGARVVEVPLADRDAVARACDGAECVVSALLGTRETMVEAQAALVDGAARAGVPRFVPSDYCIDYTALTPGRNRNLDDHRELRAIADATALRVTSILNGAFADLLTGPMPLIQPRIRRVLYWGDADQPLDFTTRDDTAAFTACAALDPEAPPYLRIAGDVVTSRSLAATLTELTGARYRVLPAGGLTFLRGMIRVMRAANPAPDDPFPAWQGMQYTRDMFEGRARGRPLENARYPGLAWTPVREVLRAAGTGRQGVAETMRTGTDL